jgi:tRNA dimethylallyltransferase
MNDSDPLPVIFLMGPTAAGKTGLAVRLVDSFPLEIVSVDSALVYRRMDIGTAKPEAEILAHAPHRLIDIRDPWEGYSAAEFRADALAAIEEIHAAGRIPLLAGGTMLYFRALQYGLSDLPSAVPEVRARIEQEAERLGWAALHVELERLDPDAAARIDPNDPQRIQRALEVIRVTGQPLSDLQTGRDRAAFPYPLLKLVISPPQRATLHQRIEERFAQMVQAGFLDEVRRLQTDPRLHADLPAMRAVGYRQAWAFLDGRLAAGEWTEKAIAATRQLAKRQLTWLRKEQGALWYDPDAEGVFEDIRNQVETFLNSGP